MLETLAVAAAIVTSAASTVAGKPVDVRCVPASARAQVSAELESDHGEDWVGLGAVGLGYVWLVDRVCWALEGVVLGEMGDEDERAVFAVAVLGHELGHVAGREDEAQATCYGIGVAKRLSAYLGIDHPFRARRRVAAMTREWGSTYACPGVPS